MEKNKAVRLVLGIMRENSGKISARAPSPVKPPQARSPTNTNVTVDLVGGSGGQ
ncbi:hypothetical protein CRG98_020392 [Punica granatum]|uniref:Uncharacterized protein n=1 Tax=Punica granatum TaxID=22663 RepID=A0A2I0JSD0_PUNGR|nr:hypothetical protein CRG98_020392 [Punica granatum]